jgi:hypothetical protein
MNALLKTSSWYILFIASMFGTLYGLGDSTTSEHFERRTEEWRIAELNDRIEAFQRAEPPRRVIVGPSYARAIQPEGFHNLGIVGAGPREIEYTLNLTHPDDEIYYVVTFRDALQGDRGNARDFIINPYIRMMTLAKARLKKSEKKIPPAPRKKSVDTQLKMFNRMKKRGLNTSILAQFYQLYPNIIFVFHPCNQLTPDIAELDNEFREKMQSFPHIDMNDLMEPDDFRDVVHLKSRGRKKFEQEFLERVKRLH